MQIEEMMLSEALSRAHTKNPKEHDIEALILSFVRFGFKAAPTIDETSGVMVAGHGRCIGLETMRTRGMPPPSGIRTTIAESGHEVWWVPVVRGVSFESDSERDAFVIADNQHVINGGWNLDALTEMLGGLDGFDGLGFEAADLAAFGIGSTISGGEDDRPHAASDDANERGGKETGVKPSQKKHEPAQLVDVDTPETPSEPVTKRGDIWKLGDSLLICGDCTSVDMPLQTLLRIGRIGFGFTSPPYNAGHNVERTVHGTSSENFAKTAAGKATRYRGSDDEMDDDEFAELLRASTALLLNVCDVALVNLQSLAANKRVIARWAGRFAEHLIDRAVWVKTTTQPAINAKVFNSQFEDLYIYANAKRPKRTISTANFHGTVSNVHTGASASRDNDHASIHGATMPVHLAQWAIENLGALADFVVDPFGGTGTTLIVATQLNKRAALVELDAAYCDVIIARWEQLTGGKAQLQ